MTCCNPNSVRSLYLTALVSSALLYASFFPLNLGFLGWVALVPLFTLIHSTARSRHIYLAAFVGGLAFYIPAIQWMRVAHPAMYATWGVLSLYSSLYFPLAIWLIRRSDRAGLPITVTAPAIWVGLEYMRMHFPTGFSWLETTGFQHRIGFGWYFMGYSQHDFVSIIQVADLAGVYGVSFLVVTVNVAIYQWVRSVRETSPRPWVPSITAAACIVAALVYGNSRLTHESFENGPRVAILQSNLPQSVKMGDGKFVQLHMYELLKKSMAVASDEFPSLVIWPETTFDLDWYDVGPGVDPIQTSTAWQTYMMQSRRVIRQMGGWRAHQLLGLNGMVHEADGQTWKYNSALLAKPDGTGGPRYDKMHLVPFGEYVPLRNTFPWMSTFTPYKGDYSCKPGEHWTRFPLPVGDKTYKFGCIICYEDTDPSLARRYVLDSPEGPPVDFLVNISNDGWFNGTEEHEQHFAICRFRAIETRRAIVRSVNMGISGIIDSDGRVVVIPGNTWSEAKKKDVVVSGMVPIDHRGSLYAQYGDWLQVICWGMILLAACGVAFRKNIGSTL